MYFTLKKNPGAGIGLSANVSLIFEYCKLISDIDCAAYFHNSAHSNRTNQVLKFVRCEFIATGSEAIIMDDAANSYGNINSTAELTFNNCHCNILHLKYRKDTFNPDLSYKYIPKNDSAFTLSKNSVGNNLDVLNYHDN